VYVSVSMSISLSKSMSVSKSMFVSVFVSMQHEHEHEHVHGHEHCHDKRSGSSFEKLIATIKAMDIILKNSRLSTNIILQNVMSPILLTKKMNALKIMRYFHRFNAHHCIYILLAQFRKAGD
jgi:hypothetical protein